VRKKVTSSTSAFEAAVTEKKKTDEETYVLRLFVAGTTPGSTRAVAALRTLCDEHLRGRYELEVVDVYQQPVLARDHQIIAVPTLVKHLPLPIRRILGDLTDRERVLMGLDLKPKSDEKKRRIKKKA
jgi:circadian clock protein KaiB